jgi:hypothetical protein
MKTVLLVIDVLWNSLYYGAVYFVLEYTYRNNFGPWVAGVLVLAGATLKVMLEKMAKKIWLLHKHPHDN